MFIETYTIYGGEIKVLTPLGLLIPSIIVGIIAIILKSIVDMIGDKIRGDKIMSKTSLIAHNIIWGILCGIIALIITVKLTPANIVWGLPDNLKSIAVLKAE